MGGKITPTRAKNVVFALNKVEIDQIAIKMDQKGQKNVFCTKNTSFLRTFCLQNIRFRDEIILSEVSLGGSLTITLALAD